MIDWLARNWVAVGLGVVVVVGVAVQVEESVRTRRVQRRRDGE